MPYRYTAESSSLPSSRCGSNAESEALGSEASDLSDFSSLKAGFEEVLDGIQDDGSFALF